MRRVVICALMAIVLAAIPAMAGPTDVPRMLLVGDSWAAFMQLFRNFDIAFRADPNLIGFGQRGSSTTKVGVEASQFDAPEYLQKVTDELLAYPTIDIVHLSLGGNDFVYSGWSPSMPSDQLDALINTTNAHISSVIDYILAIRPNIRIALCGYDFVNHQMGGATPIQMNTVWAHYAQTQLDLVRTKDPNRVFYVHNLGLMQYYYGIPQATPPVPAAPAAGHVPFPGGYAQNYVPLPGGDPNYNTPLVALMDHDLHLTMQGYDLLAQRCVDECYGTWLSYPVVVELLPQTANPQAPQQVFRVTFSKPVTGVDVPDFALIGADAAAVASVTGTGAVYQVTVNLNGDAGPPVLAVVDDDSIVDANLIPLGGPGAGNGGFAFNGPLAYADTPMPAPDDFDGSMVRLDQTFAPVDWMLGNQKFDPANCDANGGTISVEPPGIVGNGMLDSYECGVIYACLHIPTLDLSARHGVTHTIVTNAWLHNYAQMQSDLGGPAGRVLTSIPGLDTLLAAMMTLGDHASANIPVLLMSAISVFIQLPANVHTPDPANYILLGQYLGPDGDADGDGVTNRDEYNYFTTLGGKDLYVASVLDPGMIPPGSCGNSAGGWVTEGDPFCLAIPGQINMTGGFEWLKNGYALSSDKSITGNHWSELHINPLRLTDAGSYECVYDGDKIFGPVQVMVQGRKMPAAGLGALLAMGLLLAGAATRRLRK